ncbi:RNA polymerase sigma factor [Mucilaginibacter pocheonensis]|uniref:RNA polymerase sigma-70 factor (ECF subfamily) n=1 Tax=Mucilaginibacter pocheonensis TaxID=398050 RepID=A0ABU1TED0_9SPHI|nr:RNA polymerase sigma-70 factor [Mucilaginibacter pocheonensis]MDR6943758.1 RNA polymerase sigma-70 factor (ECF subfamily) [Mucilaginibacter pocheonensis]
MADNSNLSDYELKERLFLGDEDAFAEIYERYKYILHAHALNKIRNKSEAEDIIQQVFTQLWEKRAQIKSVTNLCGYLYTAVRNNILNRITHASTQKKYITSVESFAQNSTIETDYLIRQRQLMEIVEAEIGLLPARMREVFELSRKNHFSHKEIAEKLNISERTVDTQISNSLRILKGKLGPLFSICFLF